MSNIICRSVGEMNSSPDSRTISGYAVVFESWSRDLGGFKEIIRKGAITQELIDRSDVIMNINHDEDKMVARCTNGSGTLSLSLREEGLYFEFDAPPTQLGEELLYNVRNKNLFECSFAFSLPNTEKCERWYKDGEMVCREIFNIDGLYDCSIVTHAAYGSTSCKVRGLEVEAINMDEILTRMKEEEEDPKDEPTDTPTDTPEEDPDKDENRSTTDPEDEPKQEPKDEPDEAPKDGDDVDEEEEEKNKRNKSNKSNTMNKEFRLLKAINDIANNKQVDETASAVIANGTEEMRKSGLSYGGQIQIPTSEMRAAITVTTEGEDVVATEIYDILEPLRAKNVLVQAGAKFLTGLVGDVQVPSMSAGNVTWEGETAPAKDGGQTFTSVKLSPKRLTAFVDVSKQFLVQDSKAAENLIRQDILNAINSKLEETILGSEAGSLTKPEGLFYLASGSLDTVGSYEDIADMEAGIEDANVIGDCKYIMSNKAKAAFRTMQKANGTGFVYENGTIDGTQVLNTSHVESTNVAYGDFSNLAIGQWGAVDLTVDPYTKAADGMVRLVVNAYFDAKVLRPGAIVVAKEA